MRWAAVFLLFSSFPASAGEETDPHMIDATTLTVAELMALAAEERESAQAHDCCDWGGLGCRVGAVREENGREDRARLSIQRHAF